MAALIEAITLKRKMFFEFENAPYHCLDVEVSKPTARGGQTLVRLKMRNLLTRAVFDKQLQDSLLSVGGRVVKRHKPLLLPAHRQVYPGMKFMKLCRSLARSRPDGAKGASLSLAQFPWIHQVRGKGLWPSVDNSYGRPGGHLWEARVAAVESLRKSAYCCSGPIRQDTCSPRRRGRWC